jgi:eukaryotic-like serine/threonine-protein kinase
MERDRRARDRQRDDAAAVRTPSEGESSSSGAILPSDAPAQVFSPDSPTLVDMPLGLRPVPLPRKAEPRPGPVSDSGQSTLPPGMLLAQRYEIVQMLGQGGMGAVYKATDRELDRTIALKVIRPDLARDKSIVDRFKQELLLAHQVTHRNVIRIYDLSEADGMKFITMEYVEGENLLTLIHQKKKFSFPEAVEIVQQICRALEAAHSVGVIHRDLKPQNIMRDAVGRVVVMDFGLARTLEGHGMTQSGALVGTIEYMSPEQALGKDLDQRSDIYALGLLFYEMLTGQMPFKANSAVASLIKRTQEPVAPASDLDKEIPQSLSNIVGKCLERDLDLRYKSAADLFADLEAWQGNRAGATLRFEPKVGPWGQTIPWPWIATIATVIALAVSGYMLRDKLRPSPAQTSAAPTVSLAILPFRNASGDPNFDWLGPSLADMLSTDVGQSARLRTVSPDRLHQVLQDLHITANTAVDPTMLRRIAEFSNADTVVFGQYARFGEQIRIDATLQDLKNNRTIPLRADVASEKEIPTAFDKLADSIRQNLALPNDVLKELKASSYQPTSTSIESLRDYNQGVGLLREGKNVEAEKQFDSATKKDPAFALAFSKLAQTYSNLGYDAEAEQAAQKAVGLGQNLPDAEKYLLGAIQAQITKNFPAAIRAYENLAKASPGNTDVQSALAGLYEQSGDFAQASEYNQKILAANPKDINATLAMGRLAIKSDNAQAALDPLNRALTLSVQLDNQEQKAATLHAMAVAYRMLNKPEDGLRNDQEALAIWRSIGQKRGIASSLNEIARTQALLGRTKEARANFEEALEIRREIGDKRGLGDTFIDLGNFYDDRGDHDQALKMYKESLQIERDIGSESLQAACLNNIGGVYFAKGEYEDARTYYQQALQLREKSNVPDDIVESVHNLAETSVKMGEYDQALSQYMRALNLRRSMNDTRGAGIESYTLGMIMDYQGRFGAAVSSKENALKTFQDLKDKTYWMAEILGGYAQALILSGRGDEAKSYLEDALNVSRELKNDAMVSQTLAFHGDAAYYRGDPKSAGASYEQALQAATRSKEPDKILIAKINLAKVAVQEGHAQQAIASLRSLRQQAENLGLKYTLVDGSVSMAEAMMQIRDYEHAQQELERAVLLADKLGLKPLSAKAHYLLARIFRATGNQSEAQQHARDALQLLDAMRKDPGADKILQRADFKTMFEEATAWSQAPKN